MKMRFYGVIVALQIVDAYSASKIAVPNDDEHVSLAAADIVNRCFGSSEQWSELLIIPDHDSRVIVEKIHYESKTSNLIIFPDDEKSDEFTDPGKCYDYSTTDAEWQNMKTTAVIITTRDLIHLEFVLYYLKNNFKKLWRPGSYFLVVVDTQCDAVEYNSMFKVIWDLWILNAVILCPSNDPANQNQSEIELYTFNPYSADHSQQWETIIHEIVEVSIIPGNFNHSWYIFKHKFPAFGSSKDCGGLFFDKTLNLDGYLVPIGISRFEFSTDSVLDKFHEADRRLMRSIQKLLRFDVAMVVNDAGDDYAYVRGNSCYTGSLDDLYKGRSHILCVKRGITLINKPGLEVTYPHDRIGNCFASLIVGIRPQWTNFADAKHMWITVGLGLVFSTLVLYLQNKSHGIVSAFLDAERLIIGSSIIRASTAAKHRMILGSIFLVVLVVDGAIKGRFISILTVARSYPNLDSSEQLKEQKVSLYGHAAFADTIADPELRSRLDNSLVGTQCLEILERGDRQMACLGACQAMQYLAMNYPNIHISSISLLTLWAGFPTAMHWPMTNRYSFTTQKLIEAGIFEMWQLDIYRELEVLSWKLKRAEQPPYVKPTKMNELLPAFMLLFMGLSVALIVFIWEMIGRNCLSCVKS